VKTRRIPPGLERAYVEGGWWTDQTLGGMVARQLAAHPSSTVNIWSRARPWRGRYADVEDEARRLVRLLRDLGVRPGEAVAFQLPNWREAVVSFAGLALGGYRLVPIVHIYGRKEVAFILAQSGAAAYISPLAWGNLDYGAIVEQAAPASLRAHVVVGEAEAPPSSSGLVRIAWAACAARKPATDLPEVRSDQIAVLAYTSGTTSDPKGVIHDHRTMLSELRHMKAWVTPAKPNLIGSPDFESESGCMMHLSGGNMKGASVSIKRRSRGMHRNVSRCRFFQSCANCPEMEK
jgi:acyl-coenzyme A synthetase/AMP-(fatty) acid ligase